MRDQATLGLGPLDSNPEEQTNGAVAALLDDFDEDGETLYALVSFGTSYQLGSTVHTTVGEQDAVPLTLELPRP